MHHVLFVVTFAMCASACERVLDTDGDGVRDVDDNCRLDANAGQRDRDGDGFGDVCDTSPFGVVDAEPEPEPRACDADCSANVYSPCSCSAADPCAWRGDGVCDADCALVVEAPFSDDADCAVGDGDGDGDGDVGDGDGDIGDGDGDIGDGDGDGDAVLCASTTWLDFGEPEWGTTSSMSAVIFACGTADVVIVDVVVTGDVPAPFTVVAPPAPFVIPVGETVPVDFVLNATLPGSFDVEVAFIDSEGTLFALSAHGEVFPGEVIDDEWTCPPSFFGASDGCDCGCGLVDPDCESALPSSCDSFYCDEWSLLEPTDNARCRDVSCPDCAVGVLPAPEFPCLVTHDDPFGGVDDRSEVGSLTSLAAGSLFFVIEKDASGEPIRRITRAYDTANRFIWSTTDEGADFILDAVVDASWTETWFDGYSVDNGADGNLEFEVVNHYDPHGRLVEEVITYLPDAFSSKSTFHYDAFDRLAYIAVYPDADLAEPDHYYVSLYDDDASVVPWARAFRFSLDGENIHLTTFTVDLGGQMFVEAIDVGNDGVIELEISRFYDLFGRIVEEFARDHAGSVLRQSQWTYECQ